MAKYKYENDEAFQMTKEGVCEGCKGSFYMSDSGCYEDCEGFYKEYQECVAELRLEAILMTEP